MIEYSTGTVFNAGVNCMVNTVNCVGVMAAGLALEFSLRYPEMYEDYKAKCERKAISVGKVDYFHGDGYTVVNFPTKWHFKYPAQLEWIEAGIEDFLRTYRREGIRGIAFPKLGTMNGKLDWASVHPLMRRLDRADLRVIVCTDEKREAEGREREMVDLFNATSAEELARHVKLTEAQKALLRSCVPLQRFFLLQKVKGIGTKTYGEIFRYFYRKGAGLRAEQLSFFERP